MAENLFADCDKIEAVVGQAVGVVSVCWEHLGGAGVFDDVKASRAVDDAVERISQLQS